MPEGSGDWPWRKGNNGPRDYQISKSLTDNMKAVKRENCNKIIHIDIKLLATINHTLIYFIYTLIISVRCDKKIYYSLKHHSNKSVRMVSFLIHGAQFTKASFTHRTDQVIVIWPWFIHKPKSLIFHTQKRSSYTQKDYSKAQISNLFHYRCWAPEHIEANHRLDNKKNVVAKTKEKLRTAG